MKVFDLIVIGGGAAGYFGAINAALHHPDFSVLILEKSNKTLSKVKISGGGRCNVTHHCDYPSHLAKHYPRGQKELKDPFKEFDNRATVSWFAKHGVKLKTEEDGRMFPVTDNSQTIIDCFTRLAQELGVKLNLSEEVLALTPGPELWEVNTPKGVYVARNVLVATGGHPKAENYQFLSKLGIGIQAPLPSLFTFNLPAHPITGLMGVVCENALVRIPEAKLEEKGPLLVTHWGMSGPAILKLSAWGAVWLHQHQYKFSYRVNWLGGRKFDEVKQELLQLKVQRPKALISNARIQEVPQRLWDYFLQRLEIDSKKIWEDAGDKILNGLTEALVNSEFMASGKTTFKDEFVTCGGVNWSEIDPKTMQSKKHARLYFAGEVLNADGVTGGFNFQNAWTTAYLASKNLISKK